MTKPLPDQSSPESPTMTIHLRPVDADSLLAALEWAVNHPDLDMGPGLHREGAIEAGRRIEAVADLHRFGADQFSVIGTVPEPRRPHWFWAPIVAWQFKRQRRKSTPCASAAGGAAAVSSRGLACMLTSSGLPMKGIRPMADVQHTLKTLPPWYEDVATGRKNRARLLITYEDQIRDENRRRQYAYDLLPWWRKLVTKRPRVMHGGYSAYIPTEMTQQPEGDSQ